MKNFFVLLFLLSSMCAINAQNRFNIQDFGNQFLFTPKDQKQIEVCGLEIGAEYEYSITYLRGEKMFKVYGLHGEQVFGENAFIANSDCKEFNFKVGSEVTDADLLEFVIHKVILTDPNRQMQFSVQSSNNPRSLISDIFQNNKCFEIIESSIEFSGDIGTFENGEVIGTSEGIIMTTGRVNYAEGPNTCLLYTSPSPRDATLSRMPSSA